MTHNEHTCKDCGAVIIMSYAKPDDVDIEMLRARMKRRSPANPMLPDPLADRPWHTHPDGVAPHARCFVNHDAD